MLRFLVREVIFFLQKIKTFTHCILVDSSTGISWTTPLVILGVPALFCGFYFIFDRKSY